MLTGCATTNDRPAPGGGTAEVGMDVPSPVPRPQVTLQLDMPVMLGDFVNILSERVGGSIVVMNGLEFLQLEPISWRNAPFERMIRDISRPALIEVQETAHYFFLYPPDYEPLEAVSFEGRIDPDFADVTAAIGFGYRTAMFEALALMSSSLGITLISDQVIGDVQLGALTVAEAPLEVCLEALLKSARIVPEAFGVESTPEYVFIHAATNPPRQVLLNQLELTPAQTEFLDKKITLTLPSSPLNVSLIGRLEDVLPALSRQLGVEIAAQPGLEDLPVSPAVFHDVRVRTMLELMIRQWPVAEFGYRVQADRIVIERTG